MQEYTSLRTEAIDQVVAQLVKENNITPEQARNIASKYKYDPRPISTIEQEIVNLRETNNSSLEGKDISSNVEIIDSPVMHEALNTPEYFSQTTHEQAPFVQGDQANELEAMFESEPALNNTANRSNNMVADKERAKVYVKSSQPLMNTETSENGYSTLTSLLTLAVILSIVGMAVSFLITKIN